MNDALDLHPITHAVPVTPGEMETEATSAAGGP